MTDLSSDFWTKVQKSSTFFLRAIVVARICFAKPKKSHPKPDFSTKKPQKPSTEPKAIAFGSCNFAHAYTIACVLPCGKIPKFAPLLRAIVVARICFAKPKKPSLMMGGLGMKIEELHKFCVAPLTICRHISGSLFEVLP